MRTLPILYFLIPLAVSGQSITPVQQKALHNYIDFANKSSEEISVLVSAVIKYYPEIKRYQIRPSGMTPRFVCPLQPDMYYYNKAMSESNVLGGSAAALKGKIEDLRSAAAEIDAVCKALDTYHKLEDYRQDKFAGAESLIGKLLPLQDRWRKAQGDLRKEVAVAHSNLQKGISENPYHQAARMMLEMISEEKTLLDRWAFNLEESIHTGWPVEELEASILQTYNRLKQFHKATPAMKYPASGMNDAFREAMHSVLDAKREALDAYNAEARKSDRHSNQVYLDLINYFNGTLIANYNTFVEFSRQEGYYGFKDVRYCPLLTIRNQEEKISAVVQPFADIPYSPLSISSGKEPVSREEAEALNNYVDFINESLRQINYLQSVLRNFNSSASYYKTLSSSEGHGGLRFTFENFKLPLSGFQKAVVGSSVLPSSHAQSLNDQARVILNILNEMEQLAIMLEAEVQEKRYEQDRLKHVYETIERYHALFEIFDERKERLYVDVRLVFDASPLAAPGASWVKSWNALRSLTDLDHTALFHARNFYKGKSEIVLSVAAIDSGLREVLTNEYENMKGIEKLGRNHGLCPYTPYEDIPATSRTFSEKLAKIVPVKPGTSRHPYHDLVYLYNDIVDDFNKFTELSGQPLLKQIRQPELFEVKYPENQQPPATSSYLSVREQESLPPSSGEEKISSESVQVIRDTVFVERRDTVYLEGPGEPLRSMKGYAINNMVLLLDVSGSMNAPDKLPLLKKSLLDMLGMMRKEDRVSIITYSGKAKVLMPPTSFREETKIRKAIDNLQSSGKTDGNAGIRLAYQVADKNYIRGGNNRIILATDGVFNLSEETFEVADRFSKQDIFLTVFNFGTGSGNARNLERLSQAGRGNYEHINRDNAELKLIREAKGKRMK